MAIRNILTSEDETLKKLSKVVILFDNRLHSLLDDMKETLFLANGVGLAAPQIGILKRVIVINIEGKWLELINPVIMKFSGEQISVEGCLSCPNIFGLTNRPLKVTIKYQDRYGKVHRKTGTDLLAKAFCHEVDHLNGELFIDKVIRFLTPEELTN